MKYGCLVHLVQKQEGLTLRKFNCPFFSVTVSLVPQPIIVMPTTAYYLEPIYKKIRWGIVISLNGHLAIAMKSEYYKIEETVGVELSWTKLIDRLNCCG